RGRVQRYDGSKLAAQFGIRAYGLTDAAHHDLAAACGPDLHDRGDRAWRIRGPGLPGCEQPRGVRLRQYPGDAEHPCRRQRKHADPELGCDAKTATAAAATGPEQVHLRRRAGVQRPRLTVDDGDLLQGVAGEAMRPRQQSMAAARQMPGKADRWTT